MRRISAAAMSLWIVTACGDSGVSSASEGASSTSSGDGSSTGALPPPGTSTGDDTPTGSASESASTGEASSTGAVSVTTGEPDTTSTGSSSSTTTGDDTSSSGADTSTSTGDDTSSSSGDGSSSTGEPPPELGPFDVDDLDAGHGHVCARLHSGRVKCWGGYADSGDLGLGDTLPRGTTPGTMGNNLPFVDLGEGQVASAVGSYYAGCAILGGGALKCWGQGTFGALGTGNSESLGDEPGEMGDLLKVIDLGKDRTVTQVATAVWTTCAVLDDQSAKCWGWNGNGWLGQGDKNDRGDNPGEMGDLLKPINLGKDRKVVTIAIDNSHACALLDDATVKCWGQQAEGNLGNGLPGIGAIGDGPGEMGDVLKAVDFGQGRTVKQLGVGARHACVILDNDRVKCWGSNDYGQLGLGDTVRRGDDPGEMGDALPHVDLGTGRTAVQIAAAYFHSCAILDDNSLKCWGSGTLGANGQGEASNRGDGPGEMGDNLPPIDLGADRHAIKVAPGANYNCALLDNHKVKCWGVGGTQGALGYEDMSHRGDGPGEMGDALPFVDLGSE